MDFFAATQWHAPLNQNCIILNREKDLTSIYNTLFLRSSAIASIEGEYGVGKTFLAKLYAERYKLDYPGGIYYFGTPIEAQTHIESYWKLRNKSPSLYIIDETTSLSYDETSLLKFNDRYQKLVETPDTHIILIGREVPRLLLRDGFRLILSGLTRSEVDSFINKYVKRSNSNIPASVRQNLVYRSNGNLRQLYGLLNLYEENGLNDDTFLSFDCLVDSAGKPLSKNNYIQIEVANINQQLISDICKRPELVYQLTPREFEFFVADLLARDGFKVMVTPATRDGGKDIYAAKKDAIGSFLYIVECKKNKKDNLVGVHVLRNLYGVLQKERATYSMVATTSYFTNPAIEFQRTIQHQMNLCDYDKLLQWIKDNKNM